MADDPFTGDPRNPHVISFKAAMSKCGRHLAATNTISAFVRAGMSPWQAEQTLAQLTLAINNIPQPRRRGKVKLEIIKGDRK